jgi:hypothetical protein
VPLQPEVFRGRGLRPGHVEPAALIEPQRYHREHQQEQQPRADAAEQQQHDDHLAGT